MSNDLTKDEVSVVAQNAGCTWLHEPLAQRFATLCRAPLVAEVERLEQWHAEMADNRNAIASERDTLKAELEQAKKDAERYRWLRKSHHDDDSAIGVTREHMNGWGRVVGKSLRNSDLDKAIDAAIAKEQS